MRGMTPIDTSEPCLAPVPSEAPGPPADAAGPVARQSLLSATVEVLAGLSIAVFAVQLLLGSYALLAGDPQAGDMFSDAMIGAAAGLVATLIVGWRHREALRLLHYALSGLAGAAVFTAREGLTHGVATAVLPAVPVEAVVNSWVALTGTWAVMAVVTLLRQTRTGSR